MKFYILSDLHTEFGEFTPPEVDADVVVLAGDVGVGNNSVQWIKKYFPDKPVVFVTGNHEFYGRTLQKQLNAFREATANSNIHLLENDEVEIGEWIFLGCTLWTDFELFGDASIVGYDVMQRMSDFSVIRVQPKYRKLHYLDTVGFHRTSVAWLNEKFDEHGGKKIIVVTHHAPSSQAIIEKFKKSVISAAFASKLEELVASSGAALWIHGHVHSVHDYKLGDTRVICNPRGYPDEGVTGFNPSLVVEL